METAGHQKVMRAEPKPATESVTKVVNQVESAGGTMISIYTIPGAGRCNTRHLLSGECRVRSISNCFPAREGPKPLLALVAIVRPRTRLGTSLVDKGQWRKPEPHANKTRGLTRAHVVRQRKMTAGLTRKASALFPFYLLPSRGRLFRGGAAIHPRATTPSSHDWGAPVCGYQRYMHGLHSNCWLGRTLCLCSYHLL